MVKLDYFIVLLVLEIDLNEVNNKVFDLLIPIEILVNQVVNYSNLDYQVFMEVKNYD